MKEVGSVEVSVRSPAEVRLVSWALCDLRRKLAKFKADGDVWKRGLDGIYDVLKRKVALNSELSYRVWVLIADHRHNRVGTGPFLQEVAGMVGSVVGDETIEQVDGARRMVWAYDREIRKTMALIKTVEAAS